MGDRKKGKFIVFEGMDGCGKSTQLALLDEALRARGIETAVTCEPSDGETGRRLRRCLRGEEKADGKKIGELFAADRYEHVGKMLAWLETGKWVLCDRFYLSSLAYQGECLTAGELEEMNRPALERLSPDLTLYFRLTPEEAMMRTKKRGEAFELFEKLAYQQKVAKRYDRAIEARREQDRIVDIDALPSIAEIADTVWQTVALWIERESI